MEFTLVSKVSERLVRMAGTLVPGQDAAVLHAGHHVDDGLVDQVACMNVGEEQNIGVALDLAVRRSLMLCGLRVDGKVEGKRSVHDAAVIFPSSFILVSSAAST